MEAYTETGQEVLSFLNTDLEKGLSQAEAQARLAQYGENILAARKRKSLVVRFLEQLKDVMVIVLLIAAAVSFVIAILSGEGDFIDSIIILLIVILNATLGVAQESSAENALDALKDMSAPSATVRRDGTIQKIAAKELVPGDIVLLEAGNLIPADGRLIQCASLKSEESALTGESVSVDKEKDAIVKKDAPIGDRLNMVYSGCSVTYGRGIYVVTATAMETEMGKIAHLLNNEEGEKTPLQVKLDNMGKKMGLMALAICVVIFFLGLLHQEEPLTMFMTAVSLAVAAIPEGLSTVVTLVLAKGVQKMAKEGAIIRRLPAVETLGSTSVICSDKTGTLTQNRMTVMKVWVAGAEDLEEMSPHISKKAQTVLEYGTLCNDGQIHIKEDGKREDIGDPTETAIVAAALDVGITRDALSKNYPRLGEIPFDSNRKLMTTVHQMGDQYYAIVKGGYDVLLPRCTSGDHAKADQMNLIMGQAALRVLAVAYKKLPQIPENFRSEELEKDLTFVGLIGMIDPPREESKAAIATCKKAGIRTVMITGDHVVTASAIAKELGILENGLSAISGVELKEMDDKTLAENVRKYAVYARVSPEDKIRIVKAWQSIGEVVAMTGDGVNDAPALKAADIGCAMGITGTEVAKNAAAMVLTDDNFATIVGAVEEGRTIYDNIKKTIEFLLGSNIGEVLVMFLAMLLNWGTPLIAIQLLMINVVTDAFPAFALGFEKSEKNIMDRRPVPRNEGLFAGGMSIKIGLQGLMIAALTLGAFYVGKFTSLGGLGLGAEAAEHVGRTMAFLTLALSQLVHAYNCRTHESLFKTGFFGNMAMNIAFLLSLCIALLITLIPVLEEVFKMVNLTGNQWIIIACLCLSTILFVEIGKAILRLKNKSAA